jgi:hypothetical protein
MLTRLRTMGFLIADIPIYYGEPTQQMAQCIRNIQLILPPNSFCKPRYSSMPIKSLADSNIQASWDLRVEYQSQPKNDFK